MCMDTWHADIVASRRHEFCRSLWLCAPYDLARRPDCCCFTLRNGSKPLEQLGVFLIASCQSQECWRLNLCWMMTSLWITLPNTLGITISNRGILDLIATLRFGPAVVTASCCWNEATHSGQLKPQYLQHLQAWSLVLWSFFMSELSGRFDGWCR